MEDICINFVKNNSVKGIKMIGEKRLNKKNTFPEIALGAITLMVFLVQYFNNILQSISAFLIILIALTLMFVFSRGLQIRISKKVSFNWAWASALLVMLISFISAERYISVYADLIVFICGLMIISFSGNRGEVYDICFKVTKAMAIYYAMSIWIQIIFPGLYNVYLTFLTQKDNEAILRLRNMGMYTGFSTNCGFTAAHLTVGILAYIQPIRAKNKTYKYLVPIFLFTTLLMTGKRSTLLFLIMVLILAYVVSADNSEKYKRYIYCFFEFFGLLVLYFLFGNMLSFIPAFSRIVESVNGLLLGQDISSNRSVYYEYAILLFKNNPWFGIGWGNYRNATLGNVTWVNTVEVHNIYLQMATEMGVIGLAGMLVPMMTIWAKTKNLYKNSIKQNHEMHWRQVLLFSFAYQSFFLLQGLTENPLYDINFFLMYLISCSIPATYNRYLKK